MAAETRTVTVTVPPELVDACTALVEAFATLLRMDADLDKAAADAKQLGALNAVRAVREIRIEWRNAINPLLSAYEEATGEKFPRDGESDVGRISKKQAEMVAPLLVPQASFFAIGEGIAARLVARLGIRRAGQVAASIGVRSKAGALAALKLLGRLSLRGVLPASVITGLTIGFTQVAKILGVAAGLKLAFPVLKPTLDNALPYIAVGLLALWLVKR